jgi:hypothetical protein
MATKRTSAPSVTRLKKYPQWCSPKFPTREAVLL